MSNVITEHRFTRREIKEAEHDFAESIRKYFGEIWYPKSDGEYIGCVWECRSPVSIYGGLWRLCQTAKHKGAVRAFGKIEVREAGTLLRFVIFYDKKGTIQ